MINYRKLWEEYHNQKIPQGYEIHHIDGNRDNNCIENLLLVSIEEHLQIHESQGDWGAVQAILMRMDAPNAISQAASKAQKQKFREGRHNFQIMSKERRKEISSATMQKRLEKAGVAFLGIEDLVENGRRAGLVAAKNKAGFLNTDAEHHGSKFVRGTKWWNNGNQRKRTVECPGKDWVLGHKLKEK